MPASLNNIAVGSTAYTLGATLVLGAGFASRVNIIVKSAEVFYQLTEPLQGLKPESWQFGQEIFCPRMSQSLDRKTGAIRFRLAVASLTPAQVTATLYYPWEIE